MTNNKNQPLTKLEQQILNIEKTHYKYPGIKEAHAQKITGLKPTTYYQKLNQLLNNPTAIAQEPALIRRLKTKRDQHTKKAIQTFNQRARNWEP